MRIRSVTGGCSSSLVPVACSRVQKKETRKGRGKWWLRRKQNQTWSYDAIRVLPLGLSSDTGHSIELLSMYLLLGTTYPCQSVRLMSIFEHAK